MRESDGAADDAAQHSANVTHRMQGSFIKALTWKKRSKLTLGIYISDGSQSDGLSFPSHLWRQWSPHIQRVGQEDWDLYFRISCTSAHADADLVFYGAPAPLCSR